MRLICISDTHNQHARLRIPDGDVLIHAGDMCRHGDMQEVAAFGAWFGSLPHKHKIVIAGNHDFAFQRQDALARKFLPDGVCYLRDSGTEIEGVKFYGSPWQPWFCNWAFNLPRGPELAEKWSRIPNDTDVLITHGPPADILDAMETGEHLGCKDLYERVKALNLKLHVFGHIHEAYGQEQIADTLFVNACVCDENYRLINAPVVVDLDDTGARRVKE